MLGVLPGAVQSRPSLQHLYLDWLRLLLLPGYQEQGIASQSPKKKASPSTLQRNAERREEFLAKKQQSSPDSGGVEAVAEALKCDQCEYVGASEKGLKQHMRMKHKNIAPLQSTPEIPRSRDASSLPVHQIEIIDQGPWTDNAYLKAGLDECPVCHVKRPNSCDFWVDHPIVPKK